MSLKDLLPNTKDKESSEHFWALVIEPGWVQAGIWTIEKDEARVVSMSPATAWEAEEDLIGASDTALSAAVQNFDEELGEPEKTVFGVASSWVSEGQIKKEYLEKIRQICTKLSLTPSGFVVLPEAIANFLKAQEGAPLSAIVVGLGPESIEVAVFKLGNLIGTVEVARSVSISDDVAEGLSRFATGETFPSRFLVYNGKKVELEDARQSLLKTDWEILKIKFLHTPKVELIDSEKKVLAVCLAGASELADVSLIAREGEDEEAVENLVEPKEEVSPEELGFVIGEDIAKTKPTSEEVSVQAQVQKQVSRPEKADVPEAGEVKEAKKEKKKFTDRFLFFKKINPFAILRGVKKEITAVSRKTGSFDILGAMTKRMLIFGVIFLFLVLGGAFAAWWYLPKATVAIFIAPKKLEQTLTIFVDSRNGNLEGKENVLSGEALETIVSGEKTRQASGTKTVGERAKGVVSIQNGTINDISLPSGTFLVGPNDLNFTIDSQVLIPAATSPSSPGQAETNVTASDIGAEYNLAKDEKFSVGNFAKAEVDATAVSDFSGGTSKQIAVVSEEDQTQLENELVDELTEKASRELPGKIAEGELFIEEALKSEITKRSFSHKVGDETSNVKLSLTTAVLGLSVERADLLQLAKEILEEKAPAGYVLREEQVDVSFKFVGEEEGVYELAAVFTANFLPQVDTEDIKKNIVGKYPTIASDYLTGIAGFTRAEISIVPELPGRLGTLPRIGKNIKIEIAPER